jgi:hypothetical protein
MESPESVPYDEIESLCATLGVQYNAYDNKSSLKRCLRQLNAQGYRIRQQQAGTTNSSKTTTGNSLCGSPTSSALRALERTEKLSYSRTREGFIVWPEPKMPKTHAWLKPIREFPDD